MSTLAGAAHRLFSLEDYEGAMAAYRAVQRAYPQLGSLFEANIELCRNRMASAPKTSAGSGIDVTLTTIADRLHLLPRVIESLLEQSLAPASITVNVSDEPYLIDKGVAQDHPAIKNLGSLPGVSIHWTPNTGPYRKIIPYLARHFAGNPADPKLFVTVDDDTIYPRDFLATLYRHFAEKNCVVAFRGRSLTLVDHQVGPYDSWKLGTPEVSHFNMPTGKDGVLYSTAFFTPDILDEAAFRALAPTTDDLWIKWHCAVNGVPAIVLNPEAATSDFRGFPTVDFSPEYRNVSLYRVHNATSSGGKNNSAITALEQHFKARYGYCVADVLQDQLEESFA